MKKILLYTAILLLSFQISYAHVSERALTLLLPTEIYIPAGISVLVLTILITYISPKAFIGKLFRTYEIIFFKFILSCLCLIYADRKNNKAKNEPDKKLINRNKGNGPVKICKYKSILCSKSLF